MVQYYIYRARTEDNKLVTGRVEATSLEAAKKVLQQNKLIPITITVPRSLTDVVPFFNQVSLKEKTLFTRQLSTMIESGLTLVQSIRLLIRQNKRNRFQSVMVSVLNDLQDGFSFSSALAKHPDVFDSIFINVVRSGEATGKLEQVLGELARSMEKEVSVKTKIRGALFYPAFILIVMVGVALLMTVKVIPQLKDVFMASGKDLPASTKLLIVISDFTINYWYVMVFLLVVLIIGLRAYLRTLSGQMVYSKLSLHTPIAGTIIEQASMARFGRLLGMLLGSGVPLLEALRLITDSFTNQLHKKALAHVTAQVERGVPMSVPISEQPVFPVMVGQMVSVGEQTGKMDEIMMRLADYYENEVEAKVAGLATLIEPMVIVLLGIGVAWLVQAILLPIYQISTSV